MSLAVPGVVSLQTAEFGSRGYLTATLDPPKVIETPIEQLDVQYDSSRLEITFKTLTSCSPVRNGDWVVVVPQGK